MPLSRGGSLLQVCGLGGGCYKQLSTAITINHTKEGEANDSHWCQVFKCRIQSLIKVTNMMKITTSAAAAVDHCICLHCNRLSIQRITMQFPLSPFSGLTLLSSFDPRLFYVPTFPTLDHFICTLACLFANVLFLLHCLYSSEIRSCSSSDISLTNTLYPEYPRILSVHGGLRI